MNQHRTSPLLAAALTLLTVFSTSAQYPGWQQEMDCTMDITMDVDVHQYAGVMELTYINHSPDALDRIPFHLFFNAFQPESMMDVRSRNIADPDRRVGDRIVNLPEEEWGWIKITEARVGKAQAEFNTVGTIGWLTLPKALAPGKKVRIHLEWDAQVPRQVRRSGWMNAQGVEYSMTQWYPRVCEYDHHGWHTNPYIGREFHQVWGDFDVTIHMPAAYMVGGTGVLQNPEDCGHGYSDAPTPSEGMIDWHFVAEDVIDFAWAADPDFVHKTLQMEDGPMLHFIHQADTSYGAWEELP
ncbi:MAG: M1 family peptidase, partial [Flavobacteriales bacterium]